MLFTGNAVPHYKVYAQRCQIQPVMHACSGACHAPFFDVPHPLHHTVPELTEYSSESLNILKIFYRYHLKPHFVIHSFVPPGFFFNTSELSLYTYKNNLPNLHLLNVDMQRRKSNIVSSSPT